MTITVTRQMASASMNIVDMLANHLSSRICPLKARRQWGQGGDLFYSSEYLVCHRVSSHSQVSPIDCDRLDFRAA